MKSSDSDSDDEYSFDIFSKTHDNDDENTPDKTEKNR